MSKIVPPQRPQPGFVPAIAPPTPPVPPLSRRIVAPFPPSAAKAVYDPWQMLAVRPAAAASVGPRAPFEEPLDSDPLPDEAS